MLATVKTLSAESTERQWKINSMAEDVQCMKKVYVDVKQRMELLIKTSSDTDSDSVTCASHAQDTNNALTDIQNCVDETKQCLKEVEGFSHPCGGPGWRPVVNFDTSVPGAQCPSGWSQESGPVCINSVSGSCSTASIEISEPYNQVCGRVHAYSLGQSGGFSAYYNSGGDVNIDVSELFAAGVIIVRGGDEHVFSFVAGSPTTFLGTPAPDNALCPCLSDETTFEGAVGALPNFLNGDYFCESSASDFGQFQQVSLWDGLNCEPGSQCCDNGAPPYFTKTLPTANTESLDLKICRTGIEVVTIAVHLVELYVK